MSHDYKPLEEMDVMDNFMINALASNLKFGEPFCRTLLSVLLQRKIGKVKITAQKSLFPDTPKLRGIRMDIEIEEYIEEKIPKSISDVHSSKDTTSSTTNNDTELRERITTVYDVEPHLLNDCDLPKRNRFYQAKIDGRHMPNGEKDFDRLPNLYVISITDYDPFGMDHMMYVFQNQCKDLPQLTYDDGLQFIYFYTKGTIGGCEAIKNMLNYIRNSKQENAVDDATREIHNYVSHLKIDPEVKVGYMKFEEIIRYERRDATKEATLATKIQDILELLEEYGTVPQELQERLAQEKDLDCIRRLHKLAAKVNSIEEFVEKMETGTV